MIDSLAAREKNPLAAGVLATLQENAIIAKEERLPLCQDCGTTIVFAEIGQEATLVGEPLEEAINSAVADAYDAYYLRKSIVGDPLRRQNTGTNTPALIHTSITSGTDIKLTVYLKGGGSENMSCIKMFKPADTQDDIIDYIVTQVKDAGSNPCPPLFLGVGIGGTADTAMLNAKLAVLRGADTRHPDPFYAALEDVILARINAEGCGAMGFGGTSSAAGVYIKEAPAHIASLPVAVNMNCHSLRYAKRLI